MGAPCNACEAGDEHYAAISGGKACEDYTAPAIALGTHVAAPGMPDGALLISDDRAGAIYRIAYEGE